MSRQDLRFDPIALIRGFATRSKSTNDKENRPLENISNVPESRRAIDKKKSLIGKHVSETKTYETKTVPNQSVHLQPKKWVLQTKFNVFNDTTGAKINKDRSEKEHARASSSKNLRDPICMNCQEPATIKSSNDNSTNQKITQEKIPTKVAFEKAKNFFVQQESEQFNRKIEEVLFKKKLEEQRATGFLKRRHSSLDTNINFSGQPLKNHRVARLQAQHARELDLSPLEIWRVPPEIKKIKLEHRKSQAAGHSTVPLRNIPTEYREGAYAASYCKNIIDYFITIETNRQKPDVNFTSLNITWNQCQMITAFMVKNMAHNGYPSNSLHLGIRIFRDIVCLRQLQLSQLQLAALTSMWVALKRDLIAYKIPTVKDIAAYSKNAYKKEEIIDFERQLLHALNFDLSYADPFTVLSYCIMTAAKKKNIDDRMVESIYYCASYMLDLTLLDNILVELNPVLLAITAAEISLALHMETKTSTRNIQFHHWQTYDISKKFYEWDIFYVRSMIIRAIVSSCEHGSATIVVFKKYEKTRYGAVSSRLVRKITELAD